MHSTDDITRVFRSLTALEPPSPAPPASIAFSAQPNILTRLEGPSATVARTAFLTLHLLFPHELLPALDLLDRDLVSCFSPAANSSTTPEAPPRAVGQEVWYIQSASAITEADARSGGAGRYRNAMRGKATETFYEVRLDSWNCSCAAFAFQAFSLLSTREEQGERNAGHGEHEEMEAVADGYEGFRFGGTAVEGGVAPVCKHILAAALAKNLPGFALPLGKEGRVWKRDMGREELAGWAAGWGDRG